MAIISKQDEILDALTGPWTPDAYADYLQEVYGYTGRPGDEIHMNLGTYGICHYPDINITAHLYTFHDLDDKRSCVADISMDSNVFDMLIGSHQPVNSRMAWLKPRGGRHLVALLEEIDNPLNVQEPQE